MLTHKRLSRLLLCALLCSGVAEARGCTRCHAALGATASHSAQGCILCHAGDASAATESTAHRGLIAFPGNLDSAAQACGRCHADKVKGVTNSLMNSGVGMIATTRRAFAEATDRPGHNDLAHLTHSPADSLLRKQCASCHLGQNKTAHRLDASRDRGGGCLACHIDTQSAGTHPVLTARVSDARCFGCHSRSGRISLNYAGLAEASGASGQRLEDGRRVEPRPADLHHQAGMGCIDCHTERDIMGVGVEHPPVRAKQAVDIRCDDCHQITRTIARAQWPVRYWRLLARIPFHSDATTRFPVTTMGTPLWNIELRADQAWLYRKDGQGVLRIPPYQASQHPQALQHARLSCSACHSQWVPQCYGCHMDYEAGRSQYDHVDGHDTPGYWRSEQSGVRNQLPPLGVQSDRIVPVLPGMIMTVTHPDWPRPLFERRFQSIEPHTTGPARNCASCHRSSTALGLGEGTVRWQSNGKLAFHPVHRLLGDGLPADAWTGLAGIPKHAESLRPFNQREMERILNAQLPR